MKLFISYRRSDSQDLSDRLYDRLVDEFGKENVFKDVVAIEVGSDWRKQIRKSLRSCDVLLVVIGRNWLSAATDDGQRRLDMPDDWVRFEVETALQWDIPVVPLLASEVKCPAANQLPPSLADMTKFQSRPLRSDPEFPDDTNHLIAELHKLSGESITRRRVLQSLGACFLVLITLIGYWGIWRPYEQNRLREAIRAKLKSLSNELDESQKKSNDEIDVVFEGPPSYSYVAMLGAANDVFWLTKSREETAKLFNAFTNQRKRAAKIRQTACEDILNVVDQLTPFVSQATEDRKALIQIREVVVNEKKQFSDNEINGGTFDLNLGWWIGQRLTQGLFDFENAKKTDSSVRIQIKELIDSQLNKTK